MKTSFALCFDKPIIDNAIFIIKYINILQENYHASIKFTFCIAVLFIQKHC